MAMAPELTGIGIRRHFTTEGVHPYDEVVWERRDARITNFRDGSVAFEQCGVEFPVFWSQNATNIVVQKYFRGPLGSPERESSLRQVIDRVVSTIGAWGRRDGYFVDEAEAEAFEAELTHLVLHQKVAFNSPVWFNIGVAGEPQQASACMPWSALVDTPGGLVPIGKLVDDGAVGTKVFDASGLTRIVAVKANGRKLVRRIHTKAGYTLDVTGDHLVWRATDERYGEFVPAAELSPGDKLQWVRTEAFGEREITSGGIAGAALAGWMQSDGFVGQYTGTNKSLTLEAMTVTDAERAWVLDALDTLFPDIHRHETFVPTVDTALDCRRIRLYGKPLETFVERWGLRARGLDMVVPGGLFTAPLPVVAAYLRSIFQAEGYVSLKERSAVVGLAMISEPLVRGVQSLLLRFGIFSRVRFAPDHRSDRHGCWVLSIRPAGERRRFADQIGFVDPRKTAKLEASFDIPGHAAADTKRLEVERIEDLGEMDVYDIQTESGEFLAGGLRVHNCFILSVDDTMRSILNWYVEEGTIFKGGSGAGINLSNIRSSAEQLKGGGTASGPVSFMRGADASAGTIKSGGKTRRAAKMVILNTDHPDIEDFIWCKAVEERKARVLRDAGFDMDLDGKDSHSTQYQNANNSVRVTDDFMQAVVDDGEWHLRAVTTGKVVRTMRARELFRQIAEAAWECADPGMQFDTTINRWHTAANTGRINGSNPCFTGDSLVHTDKGLIRFDALLDRARQGETFGVYTHDATNPDTPSDTVHVTSPEAIMVTGLNEIVRLRFSNGMELRCTAGHRIFTTNRGYVPASELTAADAVKVLDLPAPAVNADLRLPVSSAVRDYEVTGDWSRSLRLPEKWTPELAHYLGWLVGDGCIAGDVVTTVYGGGDDQADVLPKHLELLAWMNGDRPPKPSVQANGTVQLRQSRRVIARFLEALGITHAKAAEKVVPWAVQEAPPEALAAFLRGLFDADGCVYDGKNSRYIGLASASPELLRGVQRLLATLGTFSRMYSTRKGGEDAFTHVRKDGTLAIYEARPLYDLRIGSRSIAAFADRVGFGVPAKAAKLAELASKCRASVPRPTVRLVERTDDGVELTYNLSEPRNHSFIVNGVIVRNCSEYMHLDNSACNLASLNLLRFLRDDSTFDVGGFKAAVEVVFTAQEILVGNADYPTESIAETSRRFRQLGLGYANLGALLMALGLAYDSDGGRAWAAAITALMTGQAYATSARTAARMGPFAGYTQNREPMNKVLRMHRDEVATIDRAQAPAEIVGAALQAWDDAVGWGEQHGVRNSQATVLAPTGCLVGDSLVPTEWGMVRLGALGEPGGAPWQPLDVAVATDEGPRQASHFYVNGVEPVVSVRTARGYGLDGTTRHRVKTVEAVTGEWVWRTLADLRAGDVLPLALDQLVGEPRPVALPAPAAGSSSAVQAPGHMTPELAELAGYFMGNGSLSTNGLRFSVTDGDLEVVERLQWLGKALFGLGATVAPRRDFTEVTFGSSRVAGWWEACGLARQTRPDGARDRVGAPHIPETVLYSNDPDVYAAFLRGLFEAGGMLTSAGQPRFSTATPGFARDVQALLLALGYPATRSQERARAGLRQTPVSTVAPAGQSFLESWVDQVGFVSDRKNRAVLAATADDRPDVVPVPQRLVDRLAAGSGIDTSVVAELATGTVPRELALELLERTGDAELAHLLSFVYDRVTSIELGEEQPTYDLSVPDNVTYVANGFVSHNTIGLMMDCDTTGIEPDLGLCKTKKLVGGGTMSIVNQTVPRALRRLGYSDEQIAEIVAYIDEHKSIVGAPHLSADHLSVFACSMGDNTIHYLGHVKMMAAVQPWISGAISKCVTGETLVTAAEGLVRIGSLRQDEAPDTFRNEVLEVASLDGTQKTDAFYYGGVRPVHEVVLRSGHRVAGTSNHRLLVAGPSGLDWRRLDELERGDHVATSYGADMWSVLPPRFDGFVPAPSYGSQKVVRLPSEMTSELAFLLGAYAAEGHTSRSNWTVTITNSVPSVLERVAAAWRSEFGLDARIVHQLDRCGGVVVASKTVVEFLDHLGVGERASAKRIPDAVLRSPREMVLAFLQGLALDAYVSVVTMPKWAICLDSTKLLDDLQAVLSNLGVLTGRISKRNRQNAKTYDEVYATGEQAQHMVRLVPFLEPEKAARAAYLLERRVAGNSTADVVPGISPYELYRLVPEGVVSRSEFSYLCDPRTRHVSRRSLERVAAVPGVHLPAWLRTVLDDNLHFSPVESVRFAGDRKVFDLSVPSTQAFVGNGIVNHNTINMPEEATVDDVEQLHVDAWKMGLKAVAIYRDNCKVAQPLSTTKKTVATVADAVAVAPEALAPTVVVREPVREKLPRTRRSRTFSFRVADCHGYVTVGEYDDGRPGEIFLRVAKQGSTLAGIMDAFAISVSHGLQYGVPLKAFIDMYTNMRFEPAGMTDDPDIRFASSLVDYIFRRLAVEYLSYDERVDLGILTIDERMQPTLPGVEEYATPTATGSEVVPDPAPTPRPPAPLPRPAVATDQAPPLPVASDAPYCYQCGMVMQRAGACFVCSSCGTTSGCS